MAKEFIMKAVTPEGLIFEKPIIYAKVKTINGDVGLYADHINFVSILGNGEMLIREENNMEVSYFVSGGFLEVRQDKVVILAEEMVEMSQLDAKRRAKEIAIAQSKRKKIMEEKDIMDSKRKIGENLKK